MFLKAHSCKTKYVSYTKLWLGCTYVSISLFVKNKIRFIHKTRIRLYLCFNTPIRKNKIRFTHKTRIGLHICFNTTIRLKLRNYNRRKTLQHHAYGTWSLNVHRKDSRKDNFMLYTTKSQSFSVLSCCQAGFLSAFLLIQVQ